MSPKKGEKQIVYSTRHIDFFFDRIMSSSEAFLDVVERGVRTQDKLSMEIYSKVLMKMYESDTRFIDISDIAAEIKEGDCDIATIILKFMDKLCDHKKLSNHELHRIIDKLLKFLPFVKPSNPSLSDVKSSQNLERLMELDDKKLDILARLDMDSEKLEKFLNMVEKEGGIVGSDS